MVQVQANKGHLLEAELHCCLLYASFGQPELRTPPSTLQLRHTQIYQHPQTVPIPELSS